MQMKQQGKISCKSNHKQTKFKRVIKHRNNKEHNNKDKKKNNSKKPWKDDVVNASMAKTWTSIIIWML